MLDRAANISNKEKLPLVIRFIDGAKNIYEGFVGYHLCEGTTGDAIKRIIINALSELRLLMSYCRGQSY